MRGGRQYHFYLQVPPLPSLSMSASSRRQYATTGETTQMGLMMEVLRA
jgi:hypothetical protein